VPFLKFILVAVLLRISFVSAEIMPTTSIKSLVDSADLIIAGTVKNVQQNGNGSIELSGRVYDRLDFQAEILVDETIKGEPVGRRLILDYSTPSGDIVGNVAHGGLLPNTYRVIFLNKSGSGYKFVSPYSPSLTASPKPCGPAWQVQLGEDAYLRVLQRILDLLCTDSSSEEKRAALFVLNGTEDSAAAPFLKAALSLPIVKSDPTLRMAILSDLLQWKDLSVLPLAQEDLFDQSVQSPFYGKSNLVLAISSLDPQVSIPLLARVLKSPQTEDRVAAARFLEYTNSQNALDSLLSALDDPDREVQFAVMQSLGNLTKQHQWRPTTVDADSSWDACILHWREFETERKTGASSAPTAVTPD
jgi:hypothetical protein